MTTDPDFLDEMEDTAPEGVECKHCGKGGLDWFDTGMRMRLMDEEGNFHVCGKVATDSDFDALD